MIVREIQNNTEEEIKTFDWFNDYEDTRRWAARNGYTKIVQLLDAGIKKWDQERIALFNKDK